MHLEASDDVHLGSLKSNKMSGTRQGRPGPSWDEWKKAYQNLKPQNQSAPEDLQSRVIEDFYYDPAHPTQINGPSTSYRQSQKVSACQCTI
eukprot:jgi/Mesen1/10712/ME000090S10176